MNKFNVDDRVKVIGKNVSGKIAFIGTTHFSPGEWFGIILDEAKGRNNGSIDGKQYFKCQRMYGLFVRSCQLEKEDIQSESEDNNYKNKNKSSYPNYLRVPPFGKQIKSPEKIKTGFKMKGKDISLMNKFHPMKAVIEDLKLILRTQSEELHLIRKEKIEALDKLTTTETEVQKITEELKEMIEAENKLKSKLTDAQNDVALVKKKLDKTEKRLEFSEKMRIKMDEELGKLKEMTETVIIEKEVAEEKCEHFELLVKDEEDKCKALQIEMDIMKEEMQMQVINGQPAVHYVKKLENENEVLKGALYRLKDLYEQRQQQLSHSERIAKINSKEIEDLKLEEIKKEENLGKYKKEVAELYDTLDSMLDADEIVSEVAERNLNYEDKINILCKELHDIEDQLKISEEVEETLHEIKIICREEIDCLESKLRYTQAALHKNIDLLKNREEVIEKYKELTEVLRERNRKLSEDFDRICKEKKAIAFEVENVKLRNDQVKRRNMNDLIEIEKMKYDLESYKEELNYWSQFMPDDFFNHGSDNSAVQVRLIASKIGKKLDLLIKLLQSLHYKSHKILKPEELRTLASETKFLVFAYELLGLLYLYIESYDHTNSDNFLTLGKHHKIMEQKNKEIDCYLTFLSKGEIDLECCLNNIKDTCSCLSSRLNTKYAPKNKKTIIRLSCYLNMIQISCKCISAYFVAFDSIESISSEYKTGTKKIIDTTKKVTVSVTSILNTTRNCEKENIYLVSELEDRVQGNWNAIREVMNYTIVNHQILAEDNKEALVVSLKDNENFNEIVCKLIQTDIDLYELRQQLSTGDFFFEHISYSEILSPIYSWAQFRKKEKEEVVNNLRSKVTACELEIIHLNENVKTHKQKIKQIEEVKLKDLINTKDASQQTEKQNEELVPYVPCAGDNFAMTDFLKLQLRDMECSMKYLHQKNCDLVAARIINFQNVLTPLKVLPKPKYHPDTHKIRLLQEKLNNLAVKLRGILLSTVVDITSNQRSNEAKYRKYLAERVHIRREVEDELLNIVIEVKRLKTAPRCVWSNTNPFSPHIIIEEN